MESYYIRGDIYRSGEVQDILKSKYPDALGYSYFLFSDPDHYYTSLDGGKSIRSIDVEYKNLLDAAHYIELHIDPEVEIPKFESAVMYRAIFRNVKPPHQIFSGNLYDSIKEMMIDVSPDKQDGDIFVGYKEENVWEVVR